MKHALLLSIFVSLIGCTSDQMTEHSSPSFNYSGTWACDAEDFDATLYVAPDGIASIGYTGQDPDEGHAKLEEDGSLTVIVQTGPPERFNAVFSFVPSDNGQIQLVTITLYDLYWIMWGDPKPLDDMFFRRVE